jgi:capsular exopolysaccharide synthesis family protein
MSGFQNKTISTDLIQILKRYGLALWHRAWFVLLLMGLGVLAGFLYSKSQTPMYLSSMRVMVARPVQEQASDFTRLMSNQQIVTTYAQLGQTPYFNQKVMERAGAIGFVSVFAMPDAQFITLMAQSPSPSAVKPLLNAAVEVLADEIYAIQASRYTQIEAGLTEQLQELAFEIEKNQSAIDARYVELVAAEKATLEEQIFSLEQELDALRQTDSPGSQQISQLQTRIVAYRQAYVSLIQTNRVAASKDAEVTRLERTLALYQNLYNNQSVSRENVRLSRLQGTPGLVKVEEPFEPLAPFRPTTARNTLLAAVVGLGLGLAMVLLLEFLSDTLKSSEMVRERLNVPVLGQISASQPSDSLRLEDWKPLSPESESYRVLRTNLAFSAIDRPLRLLVVTSPGSSEGKSIVVANLAAVLSQAGRKVLVVDANLRHPSLHRIFDLQNRIGLSDLFKDDVNLADLLQPYRGKSQVSFDMLTSGVLPPNPLELLASERMSLALGQMREFAEIVLVDAPSVASAPDALVLAARADGVLLVGQIGRTRVDAVRAALEQLEQSRARVLGLVLNQNPSQGKYGREWFL